MFELQKSTLSEQIDKIKNKWKELENVSGAFKYKLNVRNNKFLPGELNFYVQLNSDRGRLRRIPQLINTLQPKFNENVFNFNKCNEIEKLCDFKFNDSIVSILINQSPLTLYHSLICPSVASNLPQIITPEAIQFSIKFLEGIQDPFFRIGYNSPGALASVNHLHLHLIYLPHKLFIEQAELVLIKDDIFTLHPKYPIKAICFIINQEKSDELLIANQIYRFVKDLCEESIPHNIVFNMDHDEDNPVCKVFIFVREIACETKNLTSLNIGFCEFMGYFPFGDEALFEVISEDFIKAKLKNEIGNVFSKIEQKASEL